MCMSVCLCGLVVRVPGYRAEMYCDSCEVRTESDSGLEIRDMAIGICHADHVTPSIRKRWH
jgi:hypothetical protein